MRARIVPHLRTLGFKGSGQRYALPHDAWAQPRFQKSRGNTARSVRFTVDLPVIGKAVWERAREESPWLPVRPNPNVHYGARGEMARIGTLLPAGSDVWWSFDAGDVSVEELADPHATDVCTVIANYAVPCLNRGLAGLS